MKRVSSGAVALPLVVVTAIAAARCAPAHDDGVPGSAPPLTRAKEIHSVMQAKLNHAHAVVEAIALGDLIRVEANATRLHAVSRRTEWMVHDTVTYVALSRQFRDNTSAMAQAARDGDLTAVARAYGVMLDTCIACHTYLKRERETGNLPGKVSMIDPIRSLIEGG